MDSVSAPVQADKEPRSLTPANPELKKKLPHYTKQASNKPNGDNEVNAVYPNALEVCGMNSSRKGMGVFGGILCTTPLLFTLPSLFSEANDGSLAGVVFMAAYSFAAIFSMAIFLRQDLFTYRDEPILLNRATRKVHVFHVKRNWRRPFSKWPLVIETFDWDCVHAEIGGGLIPGSVPLLRYRLYLAFTQSPKSKRVVDRFTLGHMSNMPSAITSVWEHIRRYMEENGPPLQAGEKLRSDRKFSSRETWGETFPFVLPNGLKRFAEQPIFTIAMLIVFPVSFLMALSAWIAGVTNRDPRWPADILQAAGGAPLSDAEIAKLVPEASDDDDDEEEDETLDDDPDEPASGPPRSRPPRIKKPKVEDPTGGMNPKELAAYQAKQRAHYASLNDDELASLASIATLTPPARHVLMEEMARRGISVAE